MKTLNSDANNNFSPTASLNNTSTRFNTVNSNYFNKTRFASEIVSNPDEIKTLQKFLKSTSIKHGNADFEDVSTAKDSFTPVKSPEVIPGRFN
jgi:hypothetical protein